LAKRAALFPESDLPAPPPGHPNRRVSVAGVFVRLPAGLPIALVSPDGLADAGVDRAVGEVRRFLRDEFESADDGSATFVALLEGEIVALAIALFGRSAVYLGGGATRPDRRGLGAYRALVRARWDAAVERGTPILTVGAGAMSRPILERLGFSIVGWVDCLLDELG
jgi:GNAT superfamily N-acetyltransferase